MMVSPAASRPPRTSAADARRSVVLITAPRSRVGPLMIAVSCSDLDVGPQAVQFAHVAETVIEYSFPDPGNPGRLGQQRRQLGLQIGGKSRVRLGDDLGRSQAGPALDRNGLPGNGHLRAHAFEDRPAGCCKCSGMHALDVRSHCRRSSRRSGRSRLRCGRE